MQNCVKELVAIKVLLPADRKMQSPTLKELLLSTNSDKLIPHSYHRVRQEVSYLSKLQHDNLTKFYGVRTTPIIEGATSIICLMFELRKQNVRDVLKQYRNTKRMLEPVTQKITICQVWSLMTSISRFKVDLPSKPA